MTGINRCSEIYLLWRPPITRRGKRTVKNPVYSGRSDHERINKKTLKGASRLLFIYITLLGACTAPYLLRHLQPKWKRLQLTAHSDTSVQRLKEQYPKAEVVKADMNDAADASRLLSGVTAIWHIGPSLHPHEFEVGYTMIDAAVAESRRQGSNFQHFV
ncbi:hypothetical protein DTO217A2_1153 [Paecilomyces variotii]|nr:hypothetical protein DTO217A2_1153 [Paecilomyces variotii]